MKVLLDTNILLRHANSADPDFAVADAATDRLVRVADAVCLVPQTVSEFYVAATRAVKANGLGLSAADARSLADSFVAAFDLLPDPADLTARWLDLMEAHGVTGPNSYDGRLAAAMRRPRPLPPADLQRPGLPAVPARGGAGPRGGRLPVSRPAGPAHHFGPRKMSAGMGMLWRFRLRASRRAASSASV